MLDIEQKGELERLLAEKVHRVSRRRIDLFYPETGLLRREKYPKHLAFFAAGKNFVERCVCAANRIGKTEGIGGYETTCHLTGIYPDWWEGKTFRHGVKAWAAGSTNQTTRDILQKKLLGPINKLGTGMIPGDCVIDYKRKATSVPDTIETVYIKHISGDVSELVFKSYEQRRKAFEGTEQDVILLDEEPPLDIYSECQTRTMDVSGGRRESGIIMLTFTPLQGITDTVLQFMPDGKVGDPRETGKFAIQATWDDAPHLSDSEKKRLLAAYPPHLRDAKTKGIPIVGAGLIYPIREEDILVNDFPIPDFWPRAYSLDVGWNATATVWGAWDKENDIIYLYGEYKKGEELPLIHTEAIKSRGDWIPGVTDPHAMDANQKDGISLYKEYRDLGLVLTPANNAVETGIFKVWMGLSLGKIKVFRSLVQWLSEFRLYHRNDKGKIVKERDHLMDNTRYLVMSGEGVAITIPIEDYKMKKLIELGVIVGQKEYNPLFYGLSTN